MSTTATPAFSWDEHEYLRDDQLMLADDFEQISQIERITLALESATLRRAWQMWHELTEMVEQGRDLSPAVHHKLMRLLDECRDEINRLEAAEPSCTDAANQSSTCA